MAIEDALRQPFAVIAGRMVSEEGVEDASNGFCRSSDRKVEIEVAQGNVRLFLILKTDSDTQYIALETPNASTLGHALKVGAHLL